MMRKDIFETKAVTLQLPLKGRGGAGQWMIGGRPFEMLSSIQRERERERERERYSNICIDSELAFCPSWSP